MKELVPAASASPMKEIVAADASGEALVERDQWDRPLILPPGGHLPSCKPRKGKGGGCTCMKGYTRVSTMSEALMDSFGLNRWQKGNMLKGLARRPDLLNAARVARNPSEIYEIVDIAEVLGDNDVAARNGTFMHRLTEMLDGGYLPPADLPDNVEAMLEAYTKERERHGFTVTDTEQFVVQDKVQTAGTFDKKMDHYIGDLKTGQDLDRMVLKVHMQVACYAASDYYDIGTYERLPLGVDRDRGILIWLPWVENPKDAECEMRWLDLKWGRKAVLKAIEVRELRKINAAQMMPRIK